MEEEPGYETKPLLVDLYGDAPLTSGPTPTSEVERLLAAVERLANGPQYYNRMVVLRLLVRQLRETWNGLQKGGATP